MKLSALILGIFIPLCGCATTYSKAEIKNILDGYIGQNISVVVDKIGYPSETFVAPNGNTVYMYLKTGTYQSPQFTNYNYNAYTKTAYSTSFGGGTHSVYCKIHFETDENKAVVKWSYEGNSCR